MRKFDGTVLANNSGPCIGQWDNLTSLPGPGSRSYVMVLEVVKSRLNRPMTLSEKILH